VSGVKPGDPVVLHQYESGKTLCGGLWYATGSAPCETADQSALDAIKLLPACEASDEDIVAAAALLGITKVSRCWTRDGASGPESDTPFMDPAKVQAYLMWQVQRAFNA
jgi:hypothetical protein